MEYDEDIIGDDAAYDERCDAYRLSVESEFRSLGIDWEE